MSDRNSALLQAAVQMATVELGTNFDGVHIDTFRTSVLRHYRWLAVAAATNPVMAQAQCEAFIAENWKP